MAFFVDRRICAAFSSCGRKVTPGSKTGGGRGGINFLIEMKKDHAHNEAWQVGRRNTQKDRGNRRGGRARIPPQMMRGGGRESRRNAPAPGVERAPWLFVKAREHLLLVWQLVSPPPHFSYIPFFAFKSVSPPFSACLARVGRRLDHRQSACVLHETFIIACLKFRGVTFKEFVRVHARNFEPDGRNILET